MWISYSRLRMALYLAVDRLDAIMIFRFGQFVRARGW